MSLRETDKTTSQQDSDRRKRPVASVIIPAFNEMDGLPVVLSKLLDVVDDCFEIIVVDDGSTDRTAAVASEFKCTVVTHSVNKGKGEAMKTGLAVAKADKIIFIDADDTYPVDVIPRMCRALDDYDMVMASRTDGMDNIPAFNRVGNALFKILIRHLYGGAAVDPLTGLFGLRRAHIDRMQLAAAGFGIEAEIAICSAQMKLEVLNIPVRYGQRIGEAKLRGLQDGFHILQTILRMLPLWNPTVTFIVPALLLIAAGSGLLVAANYRVHFLEQMGLIGLHTFIVSAMIMLVGFQVLTFGLVAKVYATIHYHSRADFMARILVKTPAGLFLGLVGLGAMVAGVFWSSSLVLAWSKIGAGAFDDTRSLIAALALLVVGISSLTSGLFLSIFKSQDSRVAPPMDTQ